MTFLFHQIIIDFVAGIWENLGTNNLIRYVFSSHLCNVYLTVQNSYVPTSQATKETVSFPQTSTSPRLWYLLSTNRPLSLRGHVTNASFKQWVGILLMPKIDKVHKSYLTPEIWEETQHIKALWFFSKVHVVWFVLAAMLEGILLPSNMVAKTTFCLYLVERLLVMLRCAVNVATSSFQHSPWSLSAKFLFRKR